MSFLAAWARCLTIPLFISACACSVYGDDLLDGVSGGSSGSDAGPCETCSISGNQSAGGNQSAAGSQPAGGSQLTQGGGDGSGSRAASADGGAAANAGEAGVSGAGGADPEPACGGTIVAGQCWYLGALGASCEQTCLPRGGVSLDAATVIGTPAQGGTQEECATVLSALGIVSSPVESRRHDGRGLGCHLYGSDAYWLVSPDHDAAASMSPVRLACSCLE